MSRFWGKADIALTGMTVNDPKRTWHDDSRGEGWQRQWRFWTLPSSNAELYRQRHATVQILALVEFQKRHPL
jgi:hypothetical protein